MHDEARDTLGDTPRDTPRDTACTRRLESEAGCVCSSPPPPPPSQVPSLLPPSPLLITAYRRELKQQRKQGELLHIPYPQRIRHLVVARDLITPSNETAQMKTHSKRARCR